jgi:hypothetical protein
VLGGERRYVELSKLAELVVQVDVVLAHWRKLCTDPRGLGG